MGDYVSAHPVDFECHHSNKSMNFPLETANSMSSSRNIKISNFQMFIYLLMKLEPELAGRTLETLLKKLRSKSYLS